MNSCSIKKNSINFQGCCSHSLCVLFIQTALFRMWLYNLTWHVKVKIKKALQCDFRGFTLTPLVEVYSPCYFISPRGGKVAAEALSFTRAWSHLTVSVKLMPCACLPVQSRIAEQVRGADFSIHREKKKTYISSVNHSATSRLFHVPTAEFPGPRFRRGKNSCRVGETGFWK